MKLTTDESLTGFYLHESLQLLFNIIDDGAPPSANGPNQQLALDGSPEHHVFRIAPLRSHLFDPKRTPLLNRVNFCNSVLQRVIDLMFSRGPRITGSAAAVFLMSTLAINQLGAVYEALLSYQGFFAETDLYEVKKADEPYNELETAYFVKAEDLQQYKEEEKVYNTDGTLKTDARRCVHLIRLAGRDREVRASDYTPEVLTQALVKYALKELLQDKTADEILTLTVCEPAMGSAAFLNETVNQLAEA